MNRFEKTLAKASPQAARRVNNDGSSSDETSSSSDDDSAMIAALTSGQGMPAAPAMAASQSSLTQREGNVPVENARGDSVTSSRIMGSSTVESRNTETTLLSDLSSEASSSVGSPVLGGASSALTARAAAKESVARRKGGKSTLFQKALARSAVTGGGGESGESGRFREVESEFETVSVEKGGDEEGESDSLEDDASSRGTGGQYGSEIRAGIEKLRSRQGSSGEGGEEDSGEESEEDSEEDSEEEEEEGVEEEEDSEQVIYGWEPKLIENYEPLDMVISSLNKDITNHEKRRMKKRLDKACEEMDSKLDAIIDSDYQGFITSISAFGQIAQRISDSEQRVKALLDSLTDCRKLLHIKRESLKMMYADNLANKEMIRVLNQLDEIRNYPKMYDEYISKKHFLHAARLLSYSSELLDKELENIGALKDLKRALKERSDNLPQLLIEELHNHLYWKTKRCQMCIEAGASEMTVYCMAWEEDEQENDATNSTAEANRAGEHGGSNGKQNGKPVQEGTRRGSASLSHRASVGSGSLGAGSAAESINDGTYTAGGVLRSSISVRKQRRRTSSVRAFARLASIERGKSEVFIPEEDLKQNPEEDCFQFMVFLMESLSLVGALPNVIVAIRRRMKRELSIVTEKAFTAVIEMNEARGNELHDSPELFKALVEHIFVQYRYILSSHTFATAILRRKVTELALKQKKGAPNSIDVEVLQDIYSENDLWTCMQEELRKLLCEYLLISKEEEEQFAPAKKIKKYEQKLNENLERILSHQKDTSSQLFAFSNSNYAFGVNSFLKEEQHKKLLGVNVGVDITSDDKYTTVARPRLLCKASPLNITLVFKSLCTFAEEVDASVSGPEGGSGQLKYFVNSFCENRFLTYINDSITTKSRQSLEASDAFSVPNDFDFNSVGSSYPLTKSVLVVDLMINDLVDILKKVPVYTGCFVNMICSLLNRYLNSCNYVYKEWLHLGREQEVYVNIIKKWQANEDLLKVVRSYNSWKNIEKGRDKAPKKEGKEATATKDQEKYMHEYLLEAGIIGKGVLEGKQVTNDPSVLRMIANLHQSLEWLGMNLENLTSEMVKNSSNIQYGRLKVPLISVTEGDEEEDVEDNEANGAAGTGQYDPEMVATLDSLACDFKAHADKLLIDLRLEVRSQCFYFLNTCLKKSNFCCEEDAIQPDSLIALLNKNLCFLEERVASQLPAQKARYIFDGISHLVVIILIKNVHRITRINNNGVKKMCRNIFALQQNLSNITMTNEPAFDYARQFYCHLSFSTEKILLHIARNGPIYDKEDYQKVIELIYASQLSTNERLHHEDIEKLDHLFSTSGYEETGITANMIILSTRPKTEQEETSGLYVASDDSQLETEGSRGVAAVPEVLVSEEDNT
eukprot:Nk52_evm13s260 gene=Nk52_evmTU13s260